MCVQISYMKTIMKTYEFYIFKAYYYFLGTITQNAVQNMYQPIQQEAEMS